MGEGRGGGGGGGERTYRTDLDTRPWKECVCKALMNASVGLEDLR